MGSMSLTPDPRPGTATCYRNVFPPWICVANPLQGLRRMSKRFKKIPRDPSSNWRHTLLIETQSNPCVQVAGWSWDAGAWSARCSWAPSPLAGGTLASASEKRLQHRFKSTSASQNTAGFIYIYINIYRYIQYISMFTTHFVDQFKLLAYTSNWNPIEPMCSSCWLVLRCRSLVCTLFLGPFSK